MALKSRIKIRDSDPGFKKLRKRFEGPDRVDVGVFGEQGSAAVIKAASNEFGTDKIPERSFIRAGTDEAKDEFFKFLKDGTFEVLKGKTTKRRLIGRLGLLGVRKIQEKINRGPFTPNAPSTMRAKAKKQKGKNLGVGFSEIGTQKTSLGINRPLIDTGEMKKSITYRLEGVVKKK